MKYVLIVIILTMAAISSCDNTTNSSAKVGFNNQPKLLITLPAGYEVGDVTFSDDGFKAAVILKKDGKAFMSINSVLSSMYDDVRALVFQANSQTYAFVAGKTGKECVVINGKEGVYYDKVENPLITSYGRVVYAAKRDDKWVIVSGDKVSPVIDSPNVSLCASSDGKRLAYMESKGTTKKQNLCACSIDLKDYARGRAYDQVSWITTDLSGSHLGYRVVKDGKQSVVLFDFGQPGCSEKEGRWYDAIENFSLSNNGEHVAFFALRGGKNYLVTAENEWHCTDYKMRFNISVSDKGSVLYTGAIKQSIIIALDGKVIDDRRESIEDLTFSSDSNHSLFVTGPCPLIPTAKPVEFAYLVVDGHESKKYDKIVGPRFAPDNDHVVFRARAAGKRFLVVADREGKILQEQPPYEAVWDYKFSPDGKYVGYGVRKGQELWWQTTTLVKERQQ